MIKYIFTQFKLNEEISLFKNKSNKSYSYIIDLPQNINNMIETKELDGVLYEVTPFEHEKWETCDYDILYHTDFGVLIELQFFKSIEKYTAVVKEADYPCNVSKPYMQLLKAVKEEYRYMNVYNGLQLFSGGNTYNNIADCFNISKNLINFQGIIKYTLVNREVKSAEFIPKDKVEEMLKENDNQ